VDTLRHSHSLVYEMEELIEGDAEAPGILVSFGIDRYLQDFAAVASFFLMVTCNPDYDLVRRLTSGQRGLATASAPDKLVRKVFDSERFISEFESLAFVEFVRQLLGLQRRTFNGVMSAIRTYVTALHRMGDDLEVAYTLLVASVESLAQSFDAHQATWLDVADESRERIDAALDGSTPGVADAVRAAVLANEHVKLSRRFKEFALGNLPNDFFRGGTDGQVRPIGKQDLIDGLGEAYQTRSGYVHNLRRLPHELTAQSSFAETTTVERKTALTFQGLSRVARSVILEFVRRQPIVEAEPYDYLYETGSVVRARWAATHWMSNIASATPEGGRQWLEGFLEQLAAYFIAPQSVQFTDIRAAMEVVEPTLPGMKAPSRLAYLAVYFAFNNIFPPEQRNTNAQAVTGRWHTVFDAPSVEAMLLHSFAQPPSWGLDVHATTLDTHLASRAKRSGYRFPRLFDASMSLQLVERYRLAEQFEEAARRLTLTSENFPEYPRLRTRADEGGLAREVLWQELLLPQREDVAPTPADAGASVTPNFGAASDAGKAEPPSADSKEHLSPDSRGFLPSDVKASWWERVRAFLGFKGV
jgi:hypothetical protein